MSKKLSARSSSSRRFLTRLLLSSLPIMLLAHLVLDSSWLGRLHNIMKVWHSCQYKSHDQHRYVLSFQLCSVWFDPDTPRNYNPFFDSIIFVGVDGQNNDRQAGILLWHCTVQRMLNLTSCLMPPAQCPLCGSRDSPRDSLIYFLTNVVVIRCMYPQILI